MFVCQEKARNPRNPGSKAGGNHSPDALLPRRSVAPTRTLPRGRGALPFEDVEVGGVRAHVANVGIKDDQLDFLLASFAEGTTVAGVFTRSAFAGPSVGLSRDVAGRGSARGLVVVSKNANVANGDDGDADAAELQRRAAAVLGCAAAEVVVASTGVIGQRYPTERLWSYLDALRWPDAAGASLAEAASAIMTTDTVVKVAEAGAGDAHVVGIAKGVGMIEPDMATLLVFVFTDAAVESRELDACWRRVTDVTFNALSIDTDTSTSDTAVVFATGAAGPVGSGELETAMHEVCLRLVRMITADGEGASKSIVVDVTGAASRDQARRVAKSIVNSPALTTLLWAPCLPAEWRSATRTRANNSSIPKGFVR